MNSEHTPPPIARRLDVDVINAWTRRNERAQQHYRYSQVVAAARDIPAKERREALLRSGLSQSALAVRCHTKQGSVSAWLSGKQPTVSRSGLAFSSWLAENTP